MFYLLPPPPRAGFVFLGRHVVVCPSVYGSMGLSLKMVRLTSSKDNNVPRLSLHQNLVWSLWIPLASEFPSDLGYKSWSRKRRFPVLPVGENRVILRLLVLTHYHCVLDGSRITYRRMVWYGIVAPTVAPTGGADDRLVTWRPISSISQVKAQVTPLWKVIDVRSNYRY